MQVLIRALFGVGAVLWAWVFGAYIAIGGDTAFDVFARDGVLAAQFIPQGSTGALYGAMVIASILCAARAFRPIRWIKLALAGPFFAWSSFPLLFLSPWPAHLTAPYEMMVLQAMACVIGGLAVVADFIDRKSLL